jgi:long-chain fatty acid transport protein
MRKSIVCKRSAVFIFWVLILLFSAGSAFGSGFALIEQSASGIGNAFAGGAASAEDASTIFFNPAGMTRLEGGQIIAGSHFIIPSIRFHNEGSTSVTGVPLSGGNGDNAGVAKVTPNFYYSRKITDRFCVGIGVNSPFGLATDYPDNWVGRYHALDSDLVTININPSIAYKVNDHLSLGAGISAQHLRAELSNAIDFGTLDAIGYFEPLGIPAGSLHLTPQQSDGYVKLEGDDWAVGYNVGALYEFNKDTRIGAAYRSRIRHTLEGDADFSHVPSGLKSYPVFRDTGAEADITLPDSFSLSAFHRLTDQWMVMADFTWTNWSLFKELKVDFDNPNQPSSTTTEKWQNTYRYSFGLTYAPDKAWSFRAGTAYDRSAVADKKYRTPRIPDSDRIWVAAGVGYKLSDSFKFDVGYAHLFINDPEIDKTATGEDTLKGGLKGKYDAYIDIVSAQVTWSF